MKTMVIYQSKTGFTKKYATWIAQELSCEAKELKTVSNKEVEECDMVIFGGWIMAGTINGLDKIRNLHSKKLVVFGVGAMPNHEEYSEKIKIQNHLEETPFFYFQGGLAFEKMGFFSKMMLKMVSKSLNKKENKTAEEQEMVKLFAGSFDHADIDSIKPLTQIVDTEL